MLLLVYDRIWSGSGVWCLKVFTSNIMKYAPHNWKSRSWLNVIVVVDIRYIFSFDQTQMLFHEKYSLVTVFNG